MRSIRLGQHVVWYVGSGASGPWVVDRIQGSRITIRLRDEVRHVHVDELRPY